MLLWVYCKYKYYVCRYIYIYHISHLFIHYQYTYYRYLYVYTSCIYLFIDRYTVYTTSVAPKKPPSFCCAAKVAHHPKKFKRISSKGYRIPTITEVMRSYEVAPNLICFNALISICDAWRYTKWEKNPQPRSINLGMKLWMIVKG